MSHHLLKAIALTVLCALGSVAVASEAEFDLDARFRAKLAKEKLKQGALERKNNQLLNNSTQAADCGSQNIGNINTSGRPGTAPREVFVFAPDAINLVTGSGCK